MTLDMTRGSPAKLILQFSLPLFIGNLFQQFYNMADTFIVGRTLGAGALAAVGCTGGLNFLVIGFAQGLAAGFSITTAQRFGAGDAEGVRRSFGCSAALCGLATLVLTPLTVWGAPHILRMLHTPEDILPGAEGYIGVIFAGLGASMLFNLLASVLRAVGDSRTPLYFLIVASALNIALDILFITRFHMGVAGAAWATVLAQLFSGALCIWYIARRFAQLHFKRAARRPAWPEAAAHLRIGFPMAFQYSIIAIGAIVLQVAVNDLGSDAVAGFTTGDRLVNLFAQPLVSFGTTMATFAAQNYGAGDYLRIRKGMFQCLAMSTGYSLAAGVVSIAFGRALARVFLPGQAQVVELAHTYLVIVGAAYWVLGALFVCRLSLQGLGRSFAPTFAGVMELIMRSGAALLLAGPLGFAGVCLAEPLAWAGSAVPLFIALTLELRRLTARQTIATRK